jgi:hypothetical protein
MLAVNTRPERATALRGWQTAGYRVIDEPSMEVDPFLEEALAEDELDFPAIYKLLRRR